MRCSSSFPSEAKCDGDGVKWHHGSQAQKVTYATHETSLFFKYYINQILDKELNPLTSPRQVTLMPDGEEAVQLKKRNAIRSGWSTGSQTAKATQTWCHENNLQPRVPEELS